MATQFGGAVRPVRGLAATAVFDVEAPAAPLTPIDVVFHLDPVLIDPIAAPPVELSLGTSVVSAASATVGDCDLTSTVQAALRGSPQVREALGRLPQADRSVANAVMLWDGRWIDGASPQAREALGEIRQVVSAAVRTAPAACREEGQTGPRLFALNGPPDTVLALGSGRWRWGDLTPDPRSSTTTDTHIDTGSD